jgi:hypothetical protein
MKTKGQTSFEYMLLIIAAILFVIGVFNFINPREAEAPESFKEIGVETLLMIGGGGARPIASGPIIEIISSDDDDMVMVEDVDPDWVDKWVKIEGHCYEINGVKEDCLSGECIILSGDIEEADSFQIFKTYEECSGIAGCAPVRARWESREAQVGEVVELTVWTQNCEGGEKLIITVKDKASGITIDTIETKVSGEEMRLTWITLKATECIFTLDIPGEEPGAECGDGNCGVGENPENCGEDCLPDCGDGACQDVVCQAVGCPFAETPENCPDDCREGECKKEGESIPLVPDAPSCCEGLTLLLPKNPGLVGTMGICTAKCGNGVCDSETETSFNCLKDCKPVCSDGGCDVGEDADNCREDCLPDCGDGTCQEIVCLAIGCPKPETPENCPQDCP